ncbi:hypothetical protein [Negadavirga shengliensis]|uniref:Uncharacterized protein n=1 Tax=Negadavirga shengliensis TaxID=1389218 RepID=A0ABV9SXU5_9BACT
MQIQLDQKDTDKTGEDLLEYAETLSEALGMNTRSIQKEMTSGDFGHLVITFNKYFGEYIELLDNDNTIMSGSK